MTFAKHPFRSLLFTSMVITAPRLAEGCVVCATAIADYLFPPVLAWSLFLTAWFLTTAAITSGTSTAFSFVPSIGRAFLVVFGFLVFAAVFFGPALLLLLGVPSLLVSIRALRRPFPPTWEEYVARRLRANALAGIAVFISLAAILVYTHSTRTTAEYVLKWQGAGPAFAMVQRLAESGPDSLPDLRMIVREARPWMSSEAAEGLAAFGEPPVDVPLLIDALAKARTENQGDPEERIESALRKLSGLNLPENTPVETWREEWEGSMKSQLAAGRPNKSPQRTQVAPPLGPAR